MIILLLIHFSVESTATITQSTSPTLNFITTTIASFVPAPLRYESSWPDSASFTVTALILVCLLATTAALVFIIKTKIMGVNTNQVAPGSATG